MVTKSKLTQFCLQCNFGNLAVCIFSLTFTGGFVSSYRLDFFLYLVQLILYFMK